MPTFEDRRPTPWRLAGFALLLAAVSWGLGAFAAFPWVASDPAAAVLRVAFEHVAGFEQEGHRLSKEELEKLPRHMRPLNQERARTGKRVDTELTVKLDGLRILGKTYSPGGFRHDGPTFGYEEIPVTPGLHALEARLTDAHGAHDHDDATREHRIAQGLDVLPGQAVLVEFSEAGGFRIH